MASNYSPSLRIELIGNGEQVGIWGETTNNNLGTILETAITGNANIVINNQNYVLTAKDGAVDQARNAVLVLKNALTDFNVFAPPVNKTYIVVNDTAQDATIYCSTVQGDTTPKGTGITIPSNATGQVWADGTNINEQLNYVGGNFNIGGNLFVNGSINSSGSAISVSNGGTGVTTLTGVVFGNGTSPFTAATGIQIATAIGSTPVEKATEAAQVLTTNWTISESDGNLYFAYDGVNKVVIEPDGSISTLANVTAAATSV
jgi:hypothetical protein